MQYTHFVKLTQHPEYPDYIQTRESYKRCQQAMAAWRSKPEPIRVDEYSLLWTYADVSNFMLALARMFDEYNRVLWEEFPYCQECSGGCCCLNAAHVCDFDLLALVLLNQPLPVLTGDIYATGGDCIYLTSHGCAWPAGWRTLKCWIFYCLGGGVWNLTDTFDKRYTHITKKLTAVISRGIPEQLRVYQTISGESLGDYLSDPLDFDQVLGQAIFEILISPLDDRFHVLGDDSLKCLDSRRGSQKWLGSTGSKLDEEAFAFIAEVVELLSEPSLSILVGLDMSTGQLLSDTETMEWILLEKPENGLERLTDIYQRYALTPAPVDGEVASISYRMRQQLQKLMDTWSW